jgi:hypothetical protein
MFFFNGSQSKSRKTSRQRVRHSNTIERLEERALLTTFAVLNLGDHGTGSFRQAILDANGTAGADVITFGVTGTIGLTSSLPGISGEVNIDGTTAPAFAGAPLVAVDYNGFGGLQFNAGSSSSIVRSLALIDGADNGITINGAGGILIAGNYIGLSLDGITATPNHGSGIELFGIGASGNIIGGSAISDRNVISANLEDGIRVTSSSNNQISGNYIGTDASGIVQRGNRLDGISLNQANGNLIGNSDPVVGVTYNDTADVSLPVSGWQGIRGGDADGQYIIVGTTNTSGLLFEGTIAGGGTSYAVNYPGAFNTSIYGPNNLGDGNLQLVGVYKNPDFATADVEVNGMLFQGTVDDLNDPSAYTTIDYPGAKFNYVHSTMNGLVVGNYDSAIEHGNLNLPLGPGHAYIYSIADDNFVKDIVYPGSLSNTAYGIWYNGESSYTICGGYSSSIVNNLDDQNQPIGQAYLVDYNSLTGELSNWTSFSYPNGTNFVTHFEGISSVEKGIYTLNADSVQADSDNPVQGSFATVRRNVDRSFGTAEWVDLNYTGVDPTTNVTSSNSVYGNQVVGIVINDGNSFSYQATVNSAFQLSNVISGNGGNGIGMYGASHNTVAMNFIGTDPTGTIDLGNGQNGILVTSNSLGNLIGGEAVAGNDPTNGAFVRPPQGNLISGNAANGILINGSSTLNQMSGNFIGTDVSGNVALGNDLDGVAIVSANNNSLIGCTQVQDPFIYYNVISGNGGNGLRVKDSNNTTIQANFFGMGANNNTAVGNGLNGVIIEGSSTRTTMGGPIPLGNVVAANGKNGIVVADKASDFISFNSFVGLGAFSTNTTFGNALDGMLITSSGALIQIRTNVISSNGGDGIEVSGKAKGVQIFQNIIGLNTSGVSAMGNAGSGIKVSGKAKQIVIGGLTDSFSIIPQNVISANSGNGVALLGKARNIEINASFIGTDIHGVAAFGNALAGIHVGEGSKDNRIGSIDPDLTTVVSANGGNGIEFENTTGNTVIGTLIGTDRFGLLPLGNSGQGIKLTGSSKNAIGGTTPGQPANVIAFNALNGISVNSGSGNGIHQNGIGGNGSPGIILVDGNKGQPAPTLATASIQNDRLIVTGSLTGKRKATYTVEFFASDLNDTSGRVYLGSLTVKADSSGQAVLNFTSDVPPLGANFITATATDSKNNTSQFSVAATLPGVV